MIFTLFYRFSKICNYIRIFSKNQDRTFIKISFTFEASIHSVPPRLYHVMTPINWKAVDGIAQLETISRLGCVFTLENWDVSHPKFPKKVVRIKQGILYTWKQKPIDFQCSEKNLIISNNMVLWFLFAKQ